MKRAFLFSIVFTIASIAVSVYFKSLVASIFPKTSLALYFSAIDIVGIFMLLFIGFRSSMSVAYNRGTDVAQILGVFRLAVLVVSIVGFLVGIAIVEFSDFSIPILYLFLLFASFGFYTYFSNQLSMYRLYSDINAVTLLEPIASLVWFVVLYYAVFVRSFDALFLSSIFGLLSVSLYIFVRKNRFYKEPPFLRISLDSNTKSFIKNSIFGGMEFVFGMLIIYLAVLFIGYQFSLEILGDFQVVVKSFFMYFIAIFVFPIVKFVLPELSHLVAKKEFDGIKKLNDFAFRYAFGSGVVVFLLCYFFSSTVISWLFGESYLLAADALTTLSVAIFFVSMNTYQVAVLKSFDKFFLSMSVRACGSALFPFFAFLTHYFSATLTSVSFALTLSYASMAMISYYFVRRELLRA